MVGPATALLLLTDLMVLPSAAYGAPAAACPAGFTLMLSTENVTVCEDHRRRDGSLVFLAPTTGEQLGSPITKTAAPMYTTANNSQAPPPPDVADPKLDDVMAERQPMIHVGALDMRDPKNCAGRTGCKVWHPQGASGWDVHTFVGSRGSSVKAAFDSIGSDVNGMGYPDMNQWPDKYGRSSAVFKDRLNTTDQAEGLWGKHLPIVTMFHSYLGGSQCSRCSVPPSPCPGKPGHMFCSANPAPRQCDQPPCHWGNNSGSGWIEWTAVPVADMDGSQHQAVFFRVSKVDANGTVIDTRYFDTYALRGFEGTDLPTEINDGALVQGMGSPSGSAIAVDFYAEVLRQRDYWTATLQTEGMMNFTLPGADGILLRDQAVHVLVRDMISRHDFFWPKYGILPGLYGQPGNDGCPLTIYWSLVGALEMGAFEYAGGVLQNWLKYFTRKRGNHRRGGISNTQAFMDELIAKYIAYTGDAELVLNNWDKVLMPSLVNRALIARAKKLGSAHKAYGIPAVNDNGDLWASGVECGTTFGISTTSHEYDGVTTNSVAGDCHITMPWYDSALNMALGWKELGPLLVEIGKNASRPDVAAEGRRMVADSAELVSNINTSLNRSAGIKTDRMHLYNETCYPGWAGGPIPPYDNVCGSGSTYKFPSRDMCSGCSVGPAPTMYTKGEYGLPTRNLLMEDDVLAVIRSVYSSSAFSMTRGTWTSAEVPSSGPDQIGTGVSPWVGMQHASALKSLLLWNDPREGMPLWVGKATPRAWLEAGETIEVHNATTRWGRMSFTIRAAATGHSYTVQLALPPTCCEAGVRLRIRAPLPKKITSATAAGQPLVVNATEETVALPPSPRADWTIFVRVA